MSSKREADLIRLKNYYEPKRKRAVAFFIVGLIIIIIGAILFFRLGNISYVFLVPGLVLTTLGAFQRKTVDSDIQKVGSRLNEARTKEEEDEDRKQKSKIGRYQLKLENEKK
jgi:hypothetical protein